MAIYQDLVDGHGFTARLRQREALRAPPASRERAGGAGRDPDRAGRGGAGRLRRRADGARSRDRQVPPHPAVRADARLQPQVGAACSRMRSSARIWAELHEQAFRRLGGAPRVVVLDNLKEGVLAPDCYDPTLNPLYRDVLAHYGVTALPCRVARSRSQGQGGSRRRPRAAHAAQGAALRDRRGRADAISITGRSAGPTRASTAPPSARWPRCSPRSARTSSRCRSSRFATTSTASASCISMGTSRSSAPTTRCRPAASAPRCTCSGTATWCASSIATPASSCASTASTAPAAIAPGRRIARARTAAERRSSSCAAPSMPAPPSACSAATSSSATARSACAASSACSRCPPPRRRAVNEACAAACDLGQPTYRFVRRYLERCPRPQLALRQIDPLIRELTQYRDLIAAHTDPTEDCP